MTALHKRACEACRPDSTAVSKTGQSELLNELPHWEIVIRDGIEMLTKLYMFANWAEAMDFASKVGDLAEAHDHHPEIVIEWGKTRITWWTHTINGLHMNDFILAAKSEQL